MAKFFVHQNTNEEFYFQLVTDQEEVLLKSEMYSSKSGCLNGIESVQSNSTEADQYDVLISADDRYYFNLKASNGEVVGTSVMYEEETSRTEAIAAVMNESQDAEVIEVEDTEDMDTERVNAEEKEIATEQTSEESDDVI